MWICAYNIYHWLRLACNRSATSQSMCDSTLILFRLFVHSFFLSPSNYIYLSYYLVHSFYFFCFVYFHFLSPVDRLKPNCYYCRTVYAACMCVPISKQQFDTILFEMKSVICYHMRSFRQTPLLVYTVFVMRARAASERARIYARCVLFSMLLSENTTFIWMDMLAVTKFIAGHIASNHIQISNTILFSRQTDATKFTWAQLIY